MRLRFLIITLTQGRRIRGFEGARAPPERRSAPSHCQKHPLKTGMRSRDIFGRLRLRLRLRGSIPAPAPAPAPSKTFRWLRLRLRLRVKLFGGSGSGSGSDAQVLIWALFNQQYEFQKCQISKHDLLLTWPWVWMLLWMSAFEICHPLSSKVSDWH